MEPALNSEFQTYRFKKETGRDWYAIGLCNKNLILNNNFKFNYSTLNHGFYGISSNGGVWNSSNKSKNNKIDTFKFNAGDTIDIKFDSKNYIAIFEKN